MKSNNSNLRMLGAARMVADDIASLLKMPGIDVELADQIKRASHSISLNVAEGMGRPSGADRARFFGYAKGSVEEAKEVIHSIHNSGFIDDRRFWRIHNRLVTIARMINSYIEKMFESPRSVANNSGTNARRRSSRRTTRKT
jgi:four helix bundle protein